MPDDLETNYLLGSAVGCGGMGIVYSAIQVALGRRVAIKLPRAELAANPFVIRRFKTEARAGGRLAHRNIARVIDFGGRDGGLFLVMEYVAGIPLETIVAEQGPMTTSVATMVATQILDALQEAHTAGVIHADIKSGNVLVETLPDGSLLARVIDFGLAQFTDEDDDRQIVSGTPEYLAPEVIRGERPTVQSDLYAAGIVLYELLTGATPFGGGSSDQILTRQLEDVVVHPSLRAPDQAIPTAIEDAIMRALSKNPAARFASAAEFAAALRMAVPAVQGTRSRLARGTLERGRSTAQTLDGHRHPVMSPRPAIGNKLEIARIRLALADAVTTNDGDSIVTSYLELVHLLVDSHQLKDAAEELEHGVELLTRRPSATLPATWRLQLCLAGVYSGLGDPMRARAAARLGRELAVRASSEVGQQRAKELLVRLARHGGPRGPFA